MCLGFDEVASGLWREDSSESDEAFAEADDGKLLGEGQTGGEEKEDLIELLTFVLASPQIENA